MSRDTPDISAQYREYKMSENEMDDIDDCAALLQYCNGLPSPSSYDEARSTEVPLLSVPDADEEVRSYDAYSRPVPESDVYVEESDMMQHDEISAEMLTTEEGNPFQIKLKLSPKERLKQRNRESAKRSRDRKNQDFENDKQYNKLLTNSNSSLLQDIFDLTRKAARLKYIVEYIHAQQEQDENDVDVNQREGIDHQTNIMTAEEQLEIIKQVIRKIITEDLGETTDDEEREIEEIAKSLFTSVIKFLKENVYQNNACFESVLPPVTSSPEHTQSISFEQPVANFMPIMLEYESAVGNRFDLAFSRDGASDGSCQVPTVMNDFEDHSAPI